MITGTRGDQPTTVDQVKGVVVGMVPILVMLAVQYSIAVRMLADLEAFLLGSDNVGTGFANGVVGNMASMMLTAFVVAGAVCAATWIGRGLVAGAITGVLAYVSYAIVHIGVNAKIAAFPMIDQIMEVPSPARVLSNGVLLVLIPAAFATFLTARAVNARAHEARAQVRAHQAAVALEQRNREARAKRAAEDAARAAARGESPQEASDAADVTAVTAPMPESEPQPVPVLQSPAPTHVTCTRCGAANAMTRAACYECGTVLQPA